jgi:hypothetical protein
MGIAIAFALIASAFRNAPAALNGPPPTLQQALAGPEAAKKSSFTKVAQARPQLHAIQQRMADQFSPRVAMNQQRSDSDRPRPITC